MPQIEVLELQNAVFCNCTRYLSSALATCTRLHTLVATGLWPLDLSVISQAPNLQCLAINICRGTSLRPLAKLPQLRWAVRAHHCLCMQVDVGAAFLCMCALFLPHCCKGLQAGSSATADAAKSMIG